MIIIIIITIIMIVIIVIIIVVIVMIMIIITINFNKKDTITSLASYYVQPFEPCWQQKATHIHTLIKHAQSFVTIRHEMGQGYIKPTFGRYRLHSLHEQFCGHHFLIPDLKTLNVFTSFNSVGTKSQILEPKNDRFSVPLYTLLTGGTKKYEEWHSWQFVLRLLKISVNIGGAILL